MNHESKVVPISKISNQGGSTALNARLSPLLNQLSESFNNHLRSALGNLFENVDDVLFERADRAGSNAEQNAFFEAMREVRLKRTSIISTFHEEYKRNFTQLVKAKDQSATLAYDSFSADALSLVQNDDLEEAVAVETMVSKVLNHDVSMNLMHLSLRIDSLVPQQTINDKNNPLGPHSLCTAFVHACKSIDAEIKIKLVIFKLFEKYVLGELDKYYSDANNLLKTAGVMPHLTSAQAARRPSQRPTLSSSRKTQTSASDQAGGDTGFSAAGGDGATEYHLAQEFFNELRGLLGHFRPQVQPAIASDQPVIDHGQLMSALSQLQHQPIFQVGRLADMQNTDLAVQVRGVVQQQVHKSLGEVDEDVINLVSLVFEYILDDRNLPENFKALIGRLQIPILKVAIIDKAVFCKAAHPARKLLNEMAAAALGCDERDDQAQQALYKKTDEIVQRILNDFTDNVELFKELLDDFTQFLEKERHRAGILEQRTKDAEEGKARSEVARDTVDKTIQERLVKGQVPEVVTNLLTDAWSNVMFLAYLKEGEESKAWQDAVKTMDQLLWSITPHQRVEERKELLRLVPPLMKKIKEGLTSIAYDPFNMKELFVQIRNLQIKSLRTPRPTQETEVSPVATDQPQIKQQVVSEVPPQLPVAPESTRQKAEQAQDNNEKGQAMTSAESGQPLEQMQTANMAAMGVKAEGNKLQDKQKPLVSDASLAKLERLKVGSWVEFGQSTENRYRAKLAAYIKPNGKYIFVNRTGVKVAEKTHLDLALDIENGNITLLDDDLLFDRALQSVIGNLRKMKA
ncbi:DUF1631 domain-containing protein [Zooshikella marina]|uniref:DUF1631 domain-containing protein n=1 Tax=Zooshikella ganghwensis TaxID=202772 RepID=UPI001BAE70BA|nr:DUF1631 domain-containing protein [Zooshikella ganghwensis]MBU2707291.1 DUF1631 domain-containing protein [Zooshikella ganghwensis]